MTTENYQFHAQLITKADLIEFRNNLIHELREILGNNSKSESKEWLKSNEVRQLLKISSGTLQTLRINGTLNYSKFGRTYYYKQGDILKVLNAQSK